MQTITLPIWAVAAAAGLPGIGLIWLLVLRVCRRHKAEHTATQHQVTSHMPVRTPDSGLFAQNLLAMQVDTVFNGLVALIETERLKLNTLLNQSPFPGTPIQPVPPAQENSKADEAGMSGADGTGSPVSQQVAEAMASGQGADGVAAQLGLSRAEVELAMKLNRSQTTTPHRKLEAVV